MKDIEQKVEEIFRKHNARNLIVNLDDDQYHYELPELLNKFEENEKLSKQAILKLIEEEVRKGKVEEVKYLQTKTAPPTKHTLGLRLIAPSQFTYRLSQLEELSKKKEVNK